MFKYKKVFLAIAFFGIFNILSTPINPIATAFADNFKSFTAKELMLKNEENQKHLDIKSDATLTTSGGTRKSGEKKFESWRKLKTDGVNYMTLTRFSAPADIRNEAILFLEQAGENNEVLLYLPTFKKVRRVEAQGQRGSYMGSDFSYSDVASLHADDYDAEKKEVAPCPAESGLGKIQCLHIVATPKTPLIKLRTGYKELHLWIREDILLVTQIEYINEAGEKIKRLLLSDEKLIDPKNKKYFFYHLKMENLMNHQVTTIIYENVAINQGLKDSIFAKQQLSKVESL